MAKIDAWLQYGRGVFGFIQKINEPMFVMVFKSDNGDLIPIYDGNNEVDPGAYEVVLYRPYDSEQRQNVGYINVFPKDNVVHVVVSFALGELMVSNPCINTKDEAEKETIWKRYVQKHGESLKRYIGWDQSSALQMLNR